MRQFVSVLSDQNMELKPSKNCAQLLRLKCICHISIPDSWIGYGDKCRCIISVLVKKFCKWSANTRNLRVLNMSPLCLYELRGGYYCKTRCCWMSLPSICPTLHHKTHSAQTPPLFSRNPVAAARWPRRFIDLRHWTLLRVVSLSNEKRRAGSETHLRTLTASSRSPRDTGKGKLKELSEQI